MISNALNRFFSCRQNVLFHHLFYLLLSPELEILFACFTYIRTTGFHSSFLSLARTHHTRTLPAIFFLCYVYVVCLPQPAVTHTAALPLPSTAGWEKNKGRVKAKQLMIETGSLIGERRREGKKPTKDKKPNKANEIAHHLPQADQKSNYLPLFFFTYPSFYC